MPSFILALNRQFTALILFAYALFFAWHSVLGPVRPLGNWDMLPYVGAAYGLTKSPGDLRSAALADIRRYVSDEQYRAITSGSDYRETVARDDRAFLQRLPISQVKPFYVLLTALVGAITGNLAMATVIVSATGFFLIGLALYLLRPAGNAGSFWLLAVIGIMYFGTPQFVLLAQASTPDSMAAGLLLLGLAAFLAKARVAMATVLYSLAVMSRPDYVIPIALLAPVFLRSRMDDLCSKGGFYAVTGIPICAFVLSKVLWPGYGLLYVSQYPADVDVYAASELYLTRLRENLEWLFTLPRFLLFVGASVLAFLASRDAYVRLLVLAASGNVIVRVLLFPFVDSGYAERYFFTSYFLTLIALFRAFEASPFDLTRPPANPRLSRGAPEIRHHREGTKSEELLASDTPNGKLRMSGSTTGLGHGLMLDLALNWILPELRAKRVDATVQAEQRIDRAHRVPVGR